MKRLLISASLTNDKNRYVNLESDHIKTLNVGCFTFLHDSEHGSLHLKTPSFGILVSFVSLCTATHLASKGLFSDKMTYEYLKSEKFTVDLPKRSKRFQEAVNWAITHYENANDKH